MLTRFIRHPEQSDCQQASREGGIPHDFSHHKGDLEIY